MSRDKIYALDEYTTLDLVESDGTTATAVAGIQDISIVPEFTIDHLYTADSTIPADALQHEFLGTVEIGYAFFDGDVVKQWLGGAGGTSSSSLTDTNDPQKYQLTATFEARDASKEINATVKGITFESMPIFDAAAGEHAQWDLSGEFQNIDGVTIEAPV